MKLTGVLHGDRLPLPCEGGFRRLRIAEDGVWLELGETSIVLPEAKLLAALEEMRARRAAADRARTRR